MATLPTDPELGAPGLPGDCGTDCGQQCDDNVFVRLNVDHLVEGGSRITWELSPDFVAANPGPLEFQLQAGRTANPNASDWEPVGAIAPDTYFMIDDEKRLYGKTNWTHYRICLRTPGGLTIISPPIHALGGLSRRDWRMAKFIRDRELTRMRFAGQEGYALKRQVLGTFCTECRDHMTQEVVDPDCDNCFGTGFIPGYFPPMPCVFADVSPKARHEELDGGQSRGTVNDIVVQARMIVPPQLGEEDIWVARRSDQRWAVHKVQNVAEIKGVAIVANVELRLMPYNDQIYTIQIPGQVPA